ncbi:Flagellar FliL protein [Blastochloris viridis]|uniref:Flagellar protein FliL n=2 Tax=Blastochloris viridis TaxID=1079 RepID=A0A0H5B6Y6_BLAVI|nr:flagellar basal body-associated FliL family protein [Blastochloris viridis]ALK08790.1 Flagellar FliL protein [Blastochloris viridis]BAR97912.1 flagellar biosynthesis protein FliL [Blastochloris viridis]CUU41451.1 Flagellar FliL protein [Blastochloris viridis]
MAKNSSKSASEQEDGAEGVRPGGGKKKLILISGAVVLALALGGGGFYFFKKGDERRIEDAKLAAPKPVFFELPDITVNLAGNPGRPLYMRVKVVIEAPDPMTLEALKPVMPRVADSFQVHMREMRQTDLEGSAGIYRLREELTRRVNAAIAPARINAVLFKEIVVQ